jgi:hypothetical protein
MNFQTQSENWLQHLETRKKNPVKPSSLAQFRSHLNWLIPKMGDVPLNLVNNKLTRDVLSKLSVSPKTVSCYATTIKAIVGSALDDDEMEFRFS